MRKVFIVCVFVFMSLSSWSQEGFKFKIKIEPNTTYTTQMETTTDGVIDIIADDTILDQMQSSGVETPMKMQQESNMTMVSKTGIRDAEGNIPATMGYEKIRSKTIVNGQAVDQPSPLDSMRIVGTYTVDNKFEIDSIVGTTMNDQIRTTIAQTVETLQKQIDFPKEEIQIGDSFENEIPMRIPIQGMNPMDIVVNTTYFLKNVKDGIAFFDLKQSLTLDSVQEQMKMSATGSGTGSCEYSIDSNWLVKYQSELPMNLAMEMNEMMSIKMQMDTKTILTVTVE